MTSHIYLQKASNDLVSHCQCENSQAQITAPSQMDCPWCGCGWLFICSRCRKAFTFAEGVEVGESWSDTAERSIRGLFLREPEPDEVVEWVEFMQIMLQHVTPGQQYVYLDGYVLPCDLTDFSFEGWHSYHQLEVIPHLAALTHADIRHQTLGSCDYWESCRVE